MGSTTTMQRLLAAVPALFMSSVPAVVFAHGGHGHLSHGWVSKNKGGYAMYRHLCLALLMTLGFLLGEHHVAQATSFTFTPIDVPGAISTQARGINPSGQIAGFYDDSTGGHGFLYDGGVFTPIDGPGAFGTGARGINPRGQIVGDYFDSTGLHSFLATPTKK